MRIEAGFCSETGKRSRNEDYVALVHGDPDHGMVAALADGVGGHLGGRVAAELSVRGFIDGYLGQGPSLGVRTLAGRALDPINRWIHAIGQADPALEAMACTFTALILRGRSAHVVHVGDSRLYRLREGVLQLLTTDHVVDRRGLSHVLTRAVGLAPEITIAWEASAVRLGDRFLLCSDGVHGVLPDRRIHAILALGDCETAAAGLVRAALAAGSQDNATGCVLEVAWLPPPEQGDIEMVLSGLPLAAELGIGQSVDGFRVERVLSEARNSRVLLAQDESGGGGLRVLKLARPGASDVQARQAMVREMWIGALVRSPWLGEVVELAPERRSALYVVMPYYEGETLERRLRRLPRVSLSEGLAIGTRLGRAIAALHRAGIIHRDIKPENIVLSQGGGLRLIDLGVARLPHLEQTLDQADAVPGEPPGTASYRAPEMLAGTEQGSEASDQFALGVTLFRAFTGAYPYGEVEPFSHPRFGTPASLTKLRPDLPFWLDALLSRAVAVSPEARFGDMIELVFALEQGRESAAAAPAARIPLFARNPLRSWQVVSAVLAMLLLLSLLAR